MSYQFPFKVELESKPDYEECMQRVYAWYDHDLLDRVPVRFSAHNAEYNVVDDKSRWKTLKDRWFDAEYQVDKYLHTVKNSVFTAETFPVFWPNLGPNVFPCIMGCQVEYGDVTTWAKHNMGELDEYADFVYDEQNEHFKKLEEMTYLALEKGKGQFTVGYTDIHHGTDCADALRGTANLCMDMYDDPEQTLQFVRHCSEHFADFYNHFNNILIENRQPSVTWINIPSYESFHVPGCDLAAMLSREQFREFILPGLKEEVKVAKHNVLHMDGTGVARHLDDFLEMPELNGIQWVQGVAEDEPIMQWVPLIQKIQNAGKGVLVDLKVSELDDFMDAVSPLGIYLCIDSSDPEEQKTILNKLLKWK